VLKKMGDELRKKKVKGKKKGGGKKVKSFTELNTKREVTTKK